MKKNTNKGFTLIELLATIAVMAALALSVFPFVGDYTGWAQDTAALRSERLVEDAMARYIALGGDTSGWSSDVAIIEALKSFSSPLTGDTESVLAPSVDSAEVDAILDITFTSESSYSVNAI